MTSLVTLEKMQGIKGLRVFCPKDYNLAWHGNHTTLFGELEKKVFGDQAAFSS